ncbi:ATP-binding protein [Azospirillum agricola]|uniref:ATP-binding protein n=1 Tax=Azospirillum agricola TaxID=1720247 RepID=UPI000A0F1715|nr:ATP-binding protein [Azospirillum agricola]SMH62391.1 Anti-sigma regulatory factor (Ser/Thr protein kinase) [Azospirillum lipoferum]
MPPSDDRPAPEAALLLAVASDLENVRLLAEAACRALAPVLSDEDLIKVEIGLVEAANNVVLHACRGRGEHSIRLSCLLRDRTVTLLLEDDGVLPDGDLNRGGAPADGTAIDGAAVPCDGTDDATLPDGMAECGRGLWLIRQCFSSVHFDSQDGINRVWLRFDRGA